MQSTIIALLLSLGLLLFGNCPAVASTSSPNLIPRADLVSPVAPPVLLKHKDSATPARKKEGMRTHPDRPTKLSSSSSSSASTIAHEGGLQPISVSSGGRHKSIWSILFAAAAVEEGHSAPEDELEEQEVEDEFEEEGDGGDMLSLEDWSLGRRGIKGGAVRRRRAGQTVSRTALSGSSPSASLLSPDLTGVLVQSGSDSRWRPLS
jgi:hypothetical protein